MKKMFWPGVGMLLVGILIIWTILSAHADVPPTHISPVRIYTAHTSSDHISPVHPCPLHMRCGSYTVAGLGKRKQQVLHSGANTFDLAVAMLETETMQANYLYGDGKTGDATNFGIFKQNWFMLRNGCQQFMRQSSLQYNNGAILDKNLALDVSCLHQCQKYYGTSWFMGQRGGQSGLEHPYTADINSYKTAVDWIQQQIDARPANVSNDTRFWVDVAAI
jgi:hypothetical protein